MNAEEIKGSSRVGTCAECGQNRTVQIQTNDIENAAGDMLEAHGEPAAVYRYCESCKTSGAAILIH